jgi:hypothetical protein
MRLQWSLAVLTAANLAVLLASLSGLRAVWAQGAAPVLRGRALEIVDEQGRVRASISVVPAGTSGAGERYPETVLLRLITERGRPSVKLSATEEGSGLSFAGPTGTKDTWLTLSASGRSSSLRMKSEDGREQVLKP